MTTSPALFWFRLDLRLADNPGLAAAVRRGGAVIPVFIYAPEEEAPWQPGAASRWWLHESLKSLEAELRAAGSRLILRRGPSLVTLKRLIEETGAEAVFWNRRYEPALIQRDRVVKETLRSSGVGAESFNGALLHEPWTIQNQSGKPFQVFTAFWRHCLKKGAPEAPLRAPHQFVSPKTWPDSLPLEALQLEPDLSWKDGLRAAWRPGPAGAQARLKTFLQNGWKTYGEDRNRPDHAGTSRLSPH